MNRAPGPLGPYAGHPGCPCRRFIEPALRQRGLLERIVRVRVGTDVEAGLQVHRFTDHVCETLGEELDFLGRYVGIQKTRFGDRLDVDLDIDPDSLDAQVPMLILQPLVENSIRHGIEPRAGNGHVAVRISDRGDRLLLEVRDDGAGLPPQWTPTDEGTGLGNVRARLAQLYPGDHRFEVGPAPEGGVLIQIDIPRRVEPVLEPAGRPSQ